MCQLTLLRASASVVGPPRPRRLPSGPDGCGDGVGNWLTRVMIVWRLSQFAIASREGVYATSAASASTNTAAATAQRLWNQGRRMAMTGATDRSITRAAMSGVAGHSLPALRRPTRCSSSDARLVGNNPQQPRAWLRTGAERRQSAIRLHETLLRGVLGVGR